MIPGVLLLGVAGAVVLLGRRRARRSGLIQILETAPLGPKRSLIIARVNGETMILGSSEAGIALLGAAAKAGLPAAAPATTTRVSADADGTPAAEGAAPLDEGGLLARLFRRREQAPEIDPPMDWKEFDDLLGESLEDQELRRKLAAGLGAKVS